MKLGTYTKMKKLGIAFLNLTWLFLGSSLLWGDVLINEIMSSNSSVIADGDGDYEDWIELYNNGVEAVDLSGWGLSDNEGKPFKWVFPEGVSIDSGEYLLVWASGKDKGGAGSPLHSSFSISSAGEPILLTNPEGVSIDVIPAILIPRDVSYGRVDGDIEEWRYFNVATPGVANTTPGKLEVLQAPAFSHQGGFYSTSLSLELLHNDPGVEIYYTLDGSTPSPDNINGSTYSYKNWYPKDPTDPFGDFLTRNTQSHLYSENLLIEDNSSKPYELALINTRFSNSTFLPLGNFPKGTIIRAAAFKEGAISSPIITSTYFVSPFPIEAFDLPIFSIVADEPSLFGYDEGIYTAGRLADEWRLANPTTAYSGSNSDANYRGKGMEWERPGHLEYFSSSGDLILNQDVGIRIHGGVSRTAMRKSLRFYARSRYGADQFNYPFFGDVPYSKPDQFKRILLRNSGNDEGTTMFRDAYHQLLVASLDLDLQSYKPVHHFINGEYWGINNLRDKLDEQYIEQKYGIPAEEVAVIGYKRMSELKHGSPDDLTDFEEILDFCENNDLSIAENFNWIASRIDIKNLLLYYAFEVYIANRDWPQNNSDFWRWSQSPQNSHDAGGHDGRWRWFVFDTDQGSYAAYTDENTLVVRNTQNDG